MKALTCEMCGSTNIIKDGGVFVCQSCGTKYSVEEAKKMMVEGTVDVKGTVKVDTSDELKNLYEIARRAKDSDNSENAARYYDMILLKDPSSWEANFYVVYYKAKSCTIGQIASAAQSIDNCLPSVIELVNQNVPEEEQEAVFVEIKQRCSSIAKMLCDAAESHYLGIGYSIQEDYFFEFSNNVSSSMFILDSLASILDDKYNGKYGAMSAELWKECIRLYRTETRNLPSYSQDIAPYQKIIDAYGERIKKYIPDYTAPKLYDKNKSNSTSSSTDSPTSGCYIATAVYGSYDCPEVWTLRRFRDNTLDETWYGRLFIKLYYATSPTFVKNFGDNSTFKTYGKKVLDKFVAKLRKDGVESTPYQDKY